VTEEQRVQHGTCDPEPAAVAVVRQLELRPRGHDAHAALRRAETCGRRTDAESLERVDRARRQELGARLVTREAGAVEHEHVRPGSREPRRGRGAGRATADDDHLCVAHAGTAAMPTR
jgi:hypothetical protein